MKRRNLLFAVGCVLVLTACGSGASNVKSAAPEVAEEPVSEPEQVKEDAPAKDVKDELAEVAPVVEDPVSAVQEEGVTEETSISEESTVEVKPESESESGPSLADMESFLLNKGMLTGDRIRKEGSMVGAIDGVGYDECEIYIFDMNSEAYKKVSNGEEIFIEGLESFGGITYDAVNGPFALYLKNGGAEIVDAFNSYK